MFLRTLGHFVLMISLLVFVQPVNGQQTLTQVNGWNCYVHLPWDYNNNSNSYPTILFFPGIGEVGTNPAALISNGPGAYMNMGWNGNVKVGNDSVKFIIISLQPPTGYPNEYYINQNIQTVKSLYRIDPQRLYLTGLSMGGWCATTYVTGDLITGPYTYASQVMAVVDVEGVKPDDNQPYPNLFDNFALTGGRYLGLEQSQDFRDKQTVVNRMNATRPNSAIYIQTSFGGGGHCCWSSFYGGGGTQPTNFMLDGISQNVYQWLARQKNSAPSAYAGNDLSITLPTNQVALTGTGNDPDGLVSKFQWSTLSGPSNPAITAATSIQTSITGLIAGTYKFLFTVTDNRGASTRDTIQVLVNPAPVAPPPPAAVFGPTNVCNLAVSANNPNGTPVVYYINKVTTALSYNWSLPAGVSILAHNGGTGNSDTSITVIFGNSFSNGNVSVSSVGSLGSSAPKVLSVNKTVPAPPTAISGYADVCNYIGRRLKYSIASVPLANSYSWTVPNGCSISSGQGDTILNVIFDNSFIGGNISVVANSNCGSSATARSIAITKNLPQTPGSIMGTTDVCASMFGNNPATYSVPLVTDVKSYQWSVTGGATIISGQGNNQIQVTFPLGFTNGVLSVIAQKTCGESSPRTLNLVRNPPITPGPISASGVPCRAQRSTITYSISRLENTEYYAWTVPAAGQILSGQGTNTIVVRYTGMINSGTVTVRGSSVCGSSSVRSLAVIPIAQCNGSIGGGGFGLARTSTTDAVTNTVQIELYPNPNSGTCTITIHAPGTTAPAEIRLVDLYGRVVFSMEAANHNGYVTAKLQQPLLIEGIYQMTYRIGNITGSKRMVLKK